MRTIEADQHGVFVITDVRPPRRHTAQQRADAEDTELRRILRQAVRDAMNRQAEQVKQDVRANGLYREQMIHHMMAAQLMQPNATMSFRITAP